MGPLQTQKAMAEIRHSITIANSKIKRHKMNGYPYAYICGCSRVCGGFAIIAEYQPAPVQRVK